MQGVQVLAEEKQRRAGQGAQQVQAVNRQAQRHVKIFYERLYIGDCTDRPSFKSCELTIRIRTLSVRNIWIPTNISNILRS